MDDTIDFSTLDLFQGLSRQEATEAYSRFSWSRTDCRAGETVCMMGDSIKQLMLLTNGELHAEMYDLSGRALRIEHLEKGSTVAGPMLFSSNPEIPVQLTAAVDSTVIALPKPEALMLLSAYPGILENFLRDNGDKIAFLAEKLRLIRFATIREKIAGYFLEVSRRQGSEEIRLVYSLETLADLFGVTRPALSRSLSEMAEEGVVWRCSRGVYRIQGMELRKVLGC